MERQLQERTVEIPEIELKVTYRDFRRKEVKHLSPEEMEDFICDEVIRKVEDQAGQEWDPDDLPVSQLGVVLEAILKGLSPNGRRGSRRR